jgi:hypothetical protein
VRASQVKIGTVSYLSGTESGMRLQLPLPSDLTDTGDAPCQAY